MFTGAALITLASAEKPTLPACARPTGSMPPDAGDDMPGDLGEPSPSDGDDSQADPLDMGYSRMGHSSHYGEPSSGHARLPTFPFGPSDMSYRDGRVSYMQQDRLHHSVSSPRLSGSGHTQYPYLQRHGSGHYNEAWDTSSNRSSGSGWFPHDRSAASPISAKSQSFPPLSSPSSWPSPNSPGPGASPSSSTSNSYSFPTLNSPFFPTQAQLSNYPTASSPTTNGSANSSQYQLPAPGESRGFDHHRSYTPSSGGGNAYPSSHNNSRHSPLPLGYLALYPPSRPFPTRSSFIIAGHQALLSLQYLRLMQECGTGNASLMRNSLFPRGIFAAVSFSSFALKHNGQDGLKYSHKIVLCSFSATLTLATVVHAIRCSTCTFHWSVISLSSFLFLVFGYDLLLVVVLVPFV